MSKFNFTVVGTAATVSVLKTDKMPECGASTPVFEGSVADFQNGGMGFNICAGLAELGCSVYPVLTYADARQHDYLHSYFEEKNLPVEGIKDPPKDSCGTTIMIQDSNKNHMTLITEYDHRLPSSDYFGKQKMEDCFFEDSDYIILTAPLPINTEAAIDAIVKSGKPFVLSMRKDKNAFPHDLLYKALINANYLFANETEVEFIEKEYGLNAIEDLFNIGKMKYIAKTVGKDGSIIISKGPDNKFIYEEVPAVEVPNGIADTVGAGDGFVSGFMYGMLHGKTVKECATLGSTVSSFVLEAEGSVTNLPNESRLLERYKKTF